MNANPDIETVIEWFYEYCIEEKGYEEATATRYVSLMNTYLNTHLIGDLEFYSPEIFTVEKISNFRHTLTAIGVRYALGAFFKFLYSREFIDENMYKITLRNILNTVFPLEKNDNLREQDFLSPHDIKILFTDKLHFNTEEERYLLPLIVGLSYFCLFNQKEIAALTLQDIDLENRTLRNIQEDTVLNCAPLIKMNDDLYQFMYKYIEYRNEKYINIEYDNLIIYRGLPIENKTLNTIYSITRNPTTNLDLRQVFGHTLPKCFLGATSRMDCSTSQVARQSEKSL